jgi:Zn-dependent protease with chaperone function
MDHPSFRNCRPLRYAALLVLLVGALSVHAQSPEPAAAQSASGEDAELADDFVPTEGTQKPTKKNRFDAEKWEKRNYDRVFARRTKANLPQELSLAEPELLRRDPNLSAAAITSTIEQPEAEAYIRKHFDEFAKLFPQRLPDTHILFNDADVPNARAVATGQMVFNAGIMEKIDSVDALLFVMGHELAHIAYDHFKNEEIRRNVNEVAAVAAMVANEGNATRAGESKELMGYLFFSETMWGPQWGRANEAAADELAIDLMVRTGYSPVGAVSILRAFVAEEQKKAAEYEARCGKKGKEFGKFLLTAFGGVQTPAPPGCEAGGNLLSNAFGSLMRDHPSAEKRLAALQTYVDTRYPNYSPKPTVDIPTQMKAVLTAADSPLQRSVYASRAIEALQNGRLELAALYAVASLRDEDKTTPKPRLAMYQLLSRAGQREEAVRHLEVAISGGQAAKGIYLLALQERIATAVALTDQGEVNGDAAIIDKVLRDYAQKPDKALAVAKAQADSVAAVPAVRRTEARPELSPAARTAYEHAMALAVAGKEKFTENQEFVIHELEIKRILYPDQELIDEARKCQHSDDKAVQIYCKSLGDSLMAVLQPSSRRQ